MLELSECFIPLPLNAAQEGLISCRSGHQGGDSELGAIEQLVDGEGALSHFLDEDGVFLDVEGLWVLPVLEDVDYVGGLDFDFGLPSLFLRPTYDGVHAALIPDQTSNSPHRLIISLIFYKSPLLCHINT